MGTRTKTNCAMARRKAKEEKRKNEKVSFAELLRAEKKAQKPKMSIAMFLQKHLVTTGQAKALAITAGVPYHRVVLGWRNGRKRPGPKQRKVIRAFFGMGMGNQ